MNSEIKDLDKKKLDAVLDTIKSLTERIESIEKSLINLKRI